MKKRVSSNKKGVSSNKRRVSSIMGVTLPPPPPPPLRPVLEGNQYADTWYAGFNNLCKSCAFLQISEFLKHVKVS